MMDSWNTRYWFEKFFTPEEVKIIKAMEVESIFIDLYDFYSYDCGTEEEQRINLREAYESILHAHEKLKAREKTDDGRDN